MLRNAISHSGFVEQLLRQNAVRISEFERDSRRGRVGGSVLPGAAIPVDTTGLRLTASQRIQDPRQNHGQVDEKCLTIPLTTVPPVNPRVADVKLSKRRYAAGEGPSAGGDLARCCG